MKSVFSLHYLIWLVLSALFFAAGEFLSKKFSLAPRPSLAALIVLVYSLGTLAWLPAILQRQSLTVAGTIWAVMGLLATVLIGTAAFHERLSPVGWAGVGFAFVAIVLLSLG